MSNSRTSKTKLYSTIIGFISVLLIVVVLFAVFGRKSLQSFLPYKLSKVTEYQIVEMTEVKSSDIYLVDQSELLSALTHLTVAYRGPYNTIPVDRETQHIYHLVLVRRYQNEFDQLGTITLDENGYIYIEGSKFKVINEDPYEKIIEVCDNSFHF